MNLHLLQSMALAYAADRRTQRRFITTILIQLSQIHTIVEMILVRQTDDALKRVRISEEDERKLAQQTDQFIVETKPGALLDGAESHLRRTGADHPSAQNSTKEVRVTQGDEEEATLPNAPPGARGLKSQTPQSKASRSEQRQPRTVRAT